MRVGRRAGSRWARPAGGTAQLVCAALLMAAFVHPARVADDQGSPVRGEYVFRAAGCAACHTDVDNGGAFLAGGRRFETAFGVFYSPNITPHPEHGIGRWSAQDLVAALREGEAPDGSDYYPVFPYTSYARMQRRDVVDLWAYLQTVEAVASTNRGHELPWYLRWRFLNWIWKLLFLDSEEFRPDPGRDAQWNRGAYLVTALSHCGECHTPRTRFGVLDAERQLAGTRAGPEGGSVPNLTPDRDTGLGKWSRGEIVEYLGSGMDPDGDYAGGLMAEVVDEGTGHLSREDREAIAAYLAALEPLRNVVKKPKKKKQKDEFAY